MKKMSKLVLVLIMLTVAFPAFAGQYVKVKGGLYVPEDGDYDDSGDVKIAYGRSLNDILPGLVGGNPFLLKVSAEAGVGYYSADFSKKDSFTIGGVTQSTKAEGDYSVVPLTLTAVFDYQLPNYRQLSFYGGSGAGLYFWSGDTKVEQRSTDPLGGPDIVTSTRNDESGVEVGLHFLGGAAFEVVPQWWVTTDLEYDLISDDIGGAFLNVGVKYSF